MKKFSRIINRCQFSNKKDLKRVLSLGYLPAVNEVLKIKVEVAPQIFFQLICVILSLQNYFKSIILLIKSIISKNISIYK